MQLLAGQFDKGSSIHHLHIKPRVLAQPEEHAFLSDVIQWNMSGSATADAAMQQWRQLQTATSKRLVCRISTHA